MRPSTRLVVLNSKKYVFDLISVVAAAAYSLRRLYTSYTGAAIRVRRSSDNAEIDIGFIGEHLDLFTLFTFVGSGNGFVTTWYDQSGNGRIATQATAANQPRIVNAGVLETHQSRPTMYFDGFDDYFNHALNLAGDSTVNAVVNSFGLRAGEVASTVFTATPAGTRTDSLMYSKLPYSTEWGSYATFPISAGSINNDYAIIEAVSNNPPSGAIQLYTNGLFFIQQTGRYAGDIHTRQSIGAEHDFGANFHYGYIAEILAFPSVLSTADRQILKRGQGLYYNIAVN